jgi:hypothetical protein
MRPTTLIAGILITGNKVVDLALEYNLAVTVVIVITTAAVIAAAMVMNATMVIIENAALCVTKKDAGL